MPEQKLKHYLTSLSVKRVPNLKNEDVYKDNFSGMRYKSKNDRLTNLLLSFSVFIPMRASRTFRFEFYDYDNSRWSFEHISPQNPKGAISIPEYARIYVIKEIEKRLSVNDLEVSEKERLQAVIPKVESSEKIDADAVEFLFDSNVDEHSLGNMALLTREDNSANNNNPFMIKKLIIQNKKGNGAFIPSHTYDVFNKIQVSPASDKPFSAETFIWSQQDVDAHIKWMEKTNEDILNWLKKR